MMDSHVPLTRCGALAAWAAFLPEVGVYACRRSYVGQPPHGGVSRLSAALRHRLLTEDEVISDTLRTYDFHAAGKWLQEVCWRRYWKGWLEMRPDVWTSWRRRVHELSVTLPADVMRRAWAVASGASGVACMDAIARELNSTGYLHNHARMWWASFWIHAEGLPWELGADWFFRQLLDADPASNTLSWRWVAGLQTVGKPYLVRLCNLEKYAGAALLADRRGSGRIADGAVQAAPVEEFAVTARGPLPGFATAFTPTGRRIGLWLHADDLLPERGPLENLKPVAIAGFSSTRSYQHFYKLGVQRINALHTVLGDGAARAGQHFQVPAHVGHDDDPVTGLMLWAGANSLDEVVAFAPTVGPVRDMVPRLQRHLVAANVRLTLIRRASDTHAFGLSSAGFFPFWKKMSRHLETPAASSGA
ncbi:MAG: hypothetical protein JWM59_51 [Verrucomicrobiales bacterium]|nr:hypothetical protein [Verrucomicrobiales bacterium]